MCSTIYLFAQALNNKGEDDYYQYIHKTLSQIKEPEKQTNFSSLARKIKDQGFKIITQNISAHYLQTSKNIFKILLEINHLQQDDRQRISTTSLIIEDFSSSADFDIEIEALLNSFWRKTCRETSIVSSIAIQANDILAQIKNPKIMMILTQYWNNLLTYIQQIWMKITK